MQLRFYCGRACDLLLFLTMQVASQQTDGVLGHLMVPNAVLHTYVLKQVMRYPFYQAAHA